MEGEKQVAGYDLVLLNCRLEDRDQPADIAISGGLIALVAGRVDGGRAAELDVGGRLVSPAFVEPHIHLDKVGTLPLLGENRTGTLAEAIEILHKTKRAATEDEIAARAGAVIRQAVASGTTRIRSHVDVDTVGGLTPLRGVMRAAREHADLCDVQTVAFPQEGIVRDPGTADLMDAAMRQGGDVVGGMPHWEAGEQAAREHVEFCLRLAQRHDADVDMHVDETDDPASKTLAMLIDATVAHGWQGRVTAGHCCAMAAWDDEYAASVIARAVAADLCFVTNPATNLLLQGRLDREPRRRGLPRVKELLAAGLAVACGQDCVNDGFYPFGAADQLQVALILAHAAQLSLPAEIDAALAAIRHAAARVLGVRGYGLEPGCAADLVVLDAESMHEALRLQAARNWVIRRGSIVASTRTETAVHRPSADVHEITSL
ncbi:MAG TPA: amidohydrolase family protein [Streptosporangiaceae bacterium]|nr:amidohydrolase family protein [Streptosporangiaceae bacterium]